MYWALRCIALYNNYVFIQIRFMTPLPQKVNLNDSNKITSNRGDIHKCQGKCICIVPLRHNGNSGSKSIKNNDKIIKVRVLT